MLELVAPPAERVAEAAERDQVVDGVRQLLVGLHRVEQPVRRLPRAQQRARGEEELVGSRLEEADEQREELGARGEHEGQRTVLGEEAHQPHDLLLFPRPLLRLLAALAARRLARRAVRLVDAGGREVARLELVVVLLLVGVVDVAARPEGGEEDGDERGAVDRREGEDDELAHPERWG